jgi:hypothetical protein
MARMKSKDLIDAKIAKAHEAVVKTKKIYDSALAIREGLMTEKDERLRLELLEAFAKSDKSYAEVIKFRKDENKS